MFSTFHDLFDQSDGITEKPKPWKPHALTHEQWPPDYAGVYQWRIETLHVLRTDPNKLVSAKAYYKTRPAEFIMHWMDTYNPRKTKDRWMPFVLFARQYEFIQFVKELDEDQENGLVEKCRDIGATWLACAYSVWALLFIDDDSSGWGSRKQELVDKIGDPDSIFEKMRLLFNRLPSVWHPKGFSRREHATFMKMMNPELNSNITGESGDNIGRGGRKTRFWKDEAQPLTSGILTPFGWMTMRDMKVGSLVSTPDGRWSMVKHINDVGVAPCYVVRFVDGTSVECSENHLWTVTHNRTGKTTTERTIELFKKYKYEPENSGTQYRYHTPKTEPIEFVGRGAYPLHPYIVGALLGDGSIKHVPKYRPSMTSADPEIPAMIAKLLPDDCRIVKGKGFEYRLNDIKGARGRFKVSRASQAIMAAGIAGHGAETKFIPDMYKFGSIDDRLSLLQGLMDTDGSASGGTLTFHTCSKQLADDVRFVVQSLGGCSSQNVKPDHRGYRDMYCLHIVFDDGTIPFRLQRKIDQMKPRKRSWGKNIVDIRPIGEQIVRCITIENPDGLYLTDHCNVTHNSAHYERAEVIQSALDDNTNVQIDMSSVNGLGNVFHRKREAGIDWQPGQKIEPGYTRVFIFDWRHHPEKDQVWYDTRRKRAEREGMQHVFAQEVDRNYSAAVMNTIINYEWIQAAVDAHLKIPCLRIPPPDRWMAGLDVADEGMDRNALALRQWVILRDIQEWGERDTGVSTRKTLAALRDHKGISVQYDCIGVGSGVKAEFNRLVDQGVVAKNDFDFVPWNAGAGVVNPYDPVIAGDDESIINKNFYKNMKAQAWWALRTRFYKTWRAITLGDVYEPDELISLDGNMPNLLKLMKELAQPTKGESADLRMIVNKTPTGTNSPNLADAVVQAYFPVPDEGGYAVVGEYSG